MGRVLAVSRLCELYPGVCLTTEEKSGKNVSQGKKNFSQCVFYLLTLTIRVAFKYLTLRRLMSYIYIYVCIYGAPILDVSRSHTTTQHSR